MAVNFNDYINVLKNSRERIPKIKIDFLRYEDETSRETITAYVENSGGSINITNKNGTRRTTSFTLSNDNNKFHPELDVLDTRQKVRIWAGLEIDGEDYLFEQGVFIVENPVSRSDYSNKTFSISAVDKFSLADGTLGGETEGIYIIPVGTSIPDAIREVLQPSDDSKREIFYDPIDPIIDTIFDSETTPYSIEIGEGESVSKILFQLADMVSANIYYNVEGRLVFERDADDNIKASQYDFIDGDFNYKGTSRSFKNKNVFNAVLVVGSNINGDIARAYVENINLLSETSIPNTGWKRVKHVSDTNIYTDELAVIRAKYELKRVTNLQSEHSITTVPMYHLEEDGIITITESSMELSKQRNLINSMTIPLSTSGSMSITCARSIDLILAE